MLAPRGLAEAAREEEELPPLFPAALPLLAVDGTLNMPPCWVSARRLMVPCAVSQRCNLLRNVFF